MNKMGKWEEQEDNFVIDNYNRLKVNEIALELNRSIPSVRQRAAKLRKEGTLNGVKRSAWSEKDEEFIIANYEKMSINEMTKHLKSYHQRVMSKLTYLKKNGLIEEEKKYKYKVYKEKELQERKKQLQAERKKRKKLDKENEIKRLEEEKRKARLIELQRIEQEQIDKRQARIDRELIREKKNRDYGIGKKEIDIKLEKDKRYLLEIYSPGEHRKLKLRRKIECKLVQATHNHITFMNKDEIRESFLRKDILLGEVKIKEIV